MGNCRHVNLPNWANKQGAQPYCWSTKDTPFHSTLTHTHVHFVIVARMAFRRHRKTTANPRQHQHGRRPPESGLCPGPTTNTTTITITSTTSTPMSLEQQGAHKLTSTQPGKIEKRFLIIFSTICFNTCERARPVLFARLCGRILRFGPLPVLPLYAPPLPVVEQLVGRATLQLGGSFPFPIPIPLPFLLHWFSAALPVGGGIPEMPVALAQFLGTATAWLSVVVPTRHGWKWEDTNLRTFNFGYQTRIY